MAAQTTISSQGCPDEGRVGAVKKIKVSHNLDCPAWDLSDEYRSIESRKLQDDEKRVLQNIDNISKGLEPLGPLFKRLEGGEVLSPEEQRQFVASLQALAPLREETRILITNLKTFAACETTIDAKNTAAVSKSCEYTTWVSRLEEVTKSWELSLEKAPETLFEEYLSHPHTKDGRFLLSRRRLLLKTVLSSGEEKMIATLRPSGHEAWGELYDAISGTLKCKVGRREIGLAEATSNLRSVDEKVRQQSWAAIQVGWGEQKQACAAILNSLANWRIEIARKRSHTHEVDFLFEPLHANRVQRKTIETMFSVIEERVEVARNAARLVAKALGKNKLDPWDLAAPLPHEVGGRTRNFKEGFDLVSKAFEAVDPEMARFIHHMLENKWIEARVLPGKRQGAYCTTFPKSRTPRVFQTYMGAMGDVQILAHELGHAYHSWVMRDLPLQETIYPLTLAETASLFGEASLGEYLALQGDESTQLEIAWQDATNSVLFLLNLPARFTFEKKFYELRSQRPVSADELCALTDEEWSHWFGNVLTRPESLYWASKLHFSLATVSFYNFPYTFGYLFSLGIFSQRKKLGSHFIEIYRALLRDTGRMTAEELIAKHLGEDITKPQFWRQSLDVVESKIDVFGRLVGKRRK